VGGAWSQPNNRPKKVEDNIRQLANNLQCRMFCLSAYETSSDVDRMCIFRMIRFLYVLTVDGLRFNSPEISLIDLPRTIN